MSQMLFMRVDGIEGEEPIGDSQKMIMIASYSHGVGISISPSRPSLGKDATLRRSYCQHGLFQVTKGFDKTSPKLFDACTNGVIFPNVVIYACNSSFNSMTKSSEPKPFLSIVMTEAVMAEFQYGFSDGWQVESIGFRYSSIGWTTNWVSPEDGKAETLEPVGWDGLTNEEASVPVPSSLKWSSGSLL